MKVILAILLAATVTACQLPTPVIDIGVCTAARMQPKIAEITAQVRNCLNTGEYAVCLESIGKQVGSDIVICAVREFTGVGAGPATDPKVHQNAKNYLAAKGIQ